MAEPLAATLCPHPDWCDEITAAILETVVDTAISERSITGGIVRADVLDAVAEKTMEAVYAAIDAQVTIAENATAYAR